MRPFFGWLFFLILLLFQSACLTRDSITIRDIDIHQYLLDRDHEFFTLNCPEDHKLTVFEVEYADLDEDGTEEAVVEAATCGMGTGGADITEVLKLISPEELISLPIDDGAHDLDSLYEGIEWTPRLQVQDAKLIRWWVMYPKSSHPKSRAERTITYQWQDSVFVIEAVTTTPPPQRE